jgi:NTE family protein
MASPFRNLVFEGGGVKGMAYVGALEVLEERGILPGIVRVGGTSAGAITAVLLGLGHPLSDIASTLRRLDFRSFLDDSWGMVRDANRLVTEFGWYKGDFFRDWIAGLIRERTGNGDATFHDLAAAGREKGFRELFLIGANLSTGFAEVFSAEHTPRMCIADAARISMSIPLFFAARRSVRGDVYVDGGLIDNYPVKLFDRQKYVERHFRIPPYYAAHNERLSAAGKTNSPYVYNMETLGFRLDSAKEIAVFRDHAEPRCCRIVDFFSFTEALLETILGIQDSQHLHSDDWQRTIYIDTLGVGIIDFGIGEEAKEALVASGRQGTAAYFDAWYNDLTQSVVNRP